MTEHSLSQTIFIVEDDDQIAYLLKFFLEREGYSVITATDGQMAHDMINEVEPPDLILLDVILPFIDGFDLIKHIRTKDNWKELPVIMVSGNAQETNIVKALDAGANDYIIKPFQPMELKARIRRFI